MISFFSKYRRIVFIVTVAIFLVGVFVGLGAYVFTGDSMGAVADVGGSKISYQRFSAQVNRAMASFKDSNTEVNEVLSRTVKQEIFREMVIEELLSQQGAKMGMLVPDFEVAVEVQNTPQFRENNAFSPRAYYQTVYNEFQMSPAEYEEWRKKARLASKFKQFVYTSVKVTPEEAAAYYVAKNKSLKGFEKERAKYTDELARDKFANLANYLLRQLTVRQEIKSYLEQREQGR
ncbi:MAG: SurA N-terminal domain-containing protein [Elusimicrobiales bacterium]|nr:SurA N-terminal domain-containing protein [Elusimicrobiales bacterium]